MTTDLNQECAKWREGLERIRLRGGALEGCTRELGLTNTKYPKGVAEKFQYKARLRRLRQQLRDGKITQQQHAYSVCKVEDDYQRKPKA